MLNSFNNLTWEFECTEGYKQKMKILKTHRISIFIVMTLTILLNFSLFITKEETYWMGLFTGIVFFSSIVGLVFNYKVNKVIKRRLKNNKY